MKKQKILFFFQSRRKLEKAPSCLENIVKFRKISEFSEKNKLEKLVFWNSKAQPEKTSNIFFRKF